MIPKRLFFIWIGPNPPKYVDFAIKAFKDFNPDFEIEYIHENDINNDNKDFKIVSNLIQHKYTLYSRMYNREWAINNLSGSKQAEVTRFSDVLRYYLLNKYGGIYLDCDTYPIKPFDDKLLSYEYFKPKCYIPFQKHYHSWSDIFFMGAIKNFMYKKHNCVSIETENYITNDVINHNVSEKFYKNRENFRNCIADFDLKYCLKNEYIIHFKDCSWHKSKR